MSGLLTANSHGVIVKEYAAFEQGAEASRRYSPGDVVSVKVQRVSGEPEMVSTSYVERQNLTMRMQMRRFTRLTNAFSKKVENHALSVALHYMHYNFCRIHKSLRMTPAMAVGVTDRIWDVSDIAALVAAQYKPVVKRGPYKKKAA